jgi:hypothetical protein
MPIFVVRQTVTHPLVKEALIKEHKIIGKDLGHAIDCVRAPEPIKQKLRKSYRASFTELFGRTTCIEIIKEEKA